MKYIVMECCMSYAVVLDEEGRFHKVANMQYLVGQTVTDVIEMQVPQALPQRGEMKKWMYSAAAMAACLMVIVTSAIRIGQMPYASVYMTINPEVRIDVNKKDTVVNLEGVNSDGDDLITDYGYKKKDLDVVMDELVDRAINMGYLHEGGEISLVLDSENDQWVVSHGETLTVHLNEYLDDKLTVSIDIEDKKEILTENNVPDQEEEPQKVVIPVKPAEPEKEERPEINDYQDLDYGDSDYDDSDDDEPEDRDSDYDDPEDDHRENESDYEEEDTSQSDYEEEEEEESQTDYEVKEEDTSQTDYEEEEEESQTDYEEEEEDTSQTDYEEEKDESQTDYEEEESSDYEEEDQSDYEIDEEN